MRLLPTQISSPLDVFSLEQRYVWECPGHIIPFPITLILQPGLETSLITWGSSSWLPGVLYLVSSMVSTVILTCKRFTGLWYAYYLVLRYITDIVRFAQLDWHVLQYQYLNASEPLLGDHIELQCLSAWVCRLWFQFFTGWRCMGSKIWENV